MRYTYTNERPTRMESVYNTTSDLSAASPPATWYMQFNWHGDAITMMALDGAGGSNWTPYDPWGNPPQANPTRWNYYRWNGAWGYMYFEDLGLYYAHGRWYNPDTGMWLSPNAKGDYMYGGDGQDAVNFARYRPSPLGVGASTTTIQFSNSSSQSGCGAPFARGPKDTPITLINPGRLGFKPGVNVDWLPYLFYQNPCDFNFTASVDYNPHELGGLGSLATRSMGQANVPDILDVMEQYPITMGISGYSNNRFWTRDINFGNPNLPGSISYPGFSSYFRVEGNQVHETFPMPGGYNMVALLDPILGREGKAAGSRDALRLQSNNITFVPRDSHYPSVPLAGASVDFRTRSTGPGQLQIETVGEISQNGWGVFVRFTLQGRYNPIYPSGLTTEDILK